MFWKKIVVVAVAVVVVVVVLVLVLVLVIVIVIVVVIVVIEVLVVVVDDDDGDAKSPFDFQKCCNVKEERHLGTFSCKGLKSIKLISSIIGSQLKSYNLKVKKVC